jgi:hypothetical protein
LAQSGKFRYGLGVPFSPAYLPPLFLSRNVASTTAQSGLLERNACLCSDHSDRTAVDPTDDRIPVRERFAAASALLFGETTCH